MADQQDGLSARCDPFLEPGLAGYVEVVVRLIQQQDLIGSAQQGLEDQALLLTPRERLHPTPLHLVVRRPERRRAADVPGDLGVVAADIGEVGQCLRIAHLDVGVLRGHEEFLDGIHLGRRRAQRRW